MLNKLIEQAKNPNGIIGSWMLKIMNSAHTNMNKWALEKIEIKEKSVVLDVGCGGGKTIQLLSKMNTNGQIFGIDYSEQAVKDSLRANKNDIATGKVHIKQANVIDNQFPDSIFDVITAFQTHYFWTDLEKSVIEVFRVLKPEGCFLIVAEIYKINYHMKSYKTKVEIEQLFKKTGFIVVNFYEDTNKKWICIKGLKESK